MKITLLMTDQVLDTEGRYAISYGSLSQTKQFRSHFLQSMGSDRNHLIICN